MAGDELVRGGTITVLLPPLGQHEFLLRFQHREPADFFEITGETALGGHDRQSRSSGHDSALHSFCPRNVRRAWCTVAPRADGTSRCSIPSQMGRKEEKPLSPHRDPPAAIVAPMQFPGNPGI